VTFYRSFWLSGDVAFIDSLVEAGEALELNVLPVFAYSLKDAGPDGLPEAFRYFFFENGAPTVDAVVNTMSFAMGSSSSAERDEGEWAVALLRRMDVSQLQAMNSSLSGERWQATESGLSAWT